MKLCPNCGNQAADNAVFCDQCGTRLPEAVPVVESPVVESAAVEPVSETPAGGIPEGIILCPSCGAENVPGEVFCDICGEPLSTPEPVAAAAGEEALAEEPVVEETIVEVAIEHMIAEPLIEEVVPEAVVEEKPAADATFCAVCGSPVNAGDTFCGSCGAALGGLVEEPAVEEPVIDEAIEELVIEEPGFEVIEQVVAETVVEQAPVDQVVVEEAVAPVVAAAPICPVCGTSITPGQRFCGSCGAALATPAIPESQVEVEPEAVTVPTGPYLEVVASGAHIPLVLQPELLVGRLDEVSGIEPEVDMTPHGGLDGGVSRRHAQFHYQNGAWFVFDLDSTNGTCVNGKEIAPKTRVPVQDGIKIEFGEVELIFHAG